MFREVPVLPVVIPSAALVFAALLWVLHRRDRLSAPRVAVAAALCVYAAGVVANTVFPIFVERPGHAVQKWHLFLVPLADYELADALENIVVFIPLGMLVPLLLARVTWWRVLAVGAAFSLTIELAQLVAGRFWDGGHIADVNDLAFNVAGAALGLGLLAALAHVPVAERLVDHFRWA